MSQLACSKIRQFLSKNSRIYWSSFAYNRRMDLLSMP